MKALIIAAALIASPVIAEEAGEFSIRGRITRAITGADIIVGGKNVHLEGMRAPKRGRICIRAGENVDIGTEVANGLARKIVGSDADILAHTDESGRLVGRGTVNGEDIGEIAITNGFAVSKSATLPMPIRSARPVISDSAYGPAARSRKRRSSRKWRSSVWRFCNKVL